VSKICPTCGDDLRLVRVLTGALFKGGRWEVWTHVITGSALCTRDLEMNPDTGELADARGLLL
jgi:hypothetical protein